MPATATPDTSPTRVATPTPTLTPTPRPVEPTSYLGIAPDGAIRRLGLGSIESIAVSPDGTRLAVGTSVGLYLYDALSFELLWFNPSRIYFVDGLTFSVDGRLIAGHEAGRVYVWNAFTGEPIFDRPMGGHQGPVLISPDGEKVIARGRTILVWSLVSGEVLDSYDSPVGPFEQMALSPNTDLLAFQNRDGEAVLLDVRDGSMHILPDDQGYYFIFSPDGRYLASESNGKRRITIWEVATRTPVSVFDSDAEMTPMAFTPDGRLLLVLAGRDGFDMLDTQAGRIEASVADIDSLGWLSTISSRGEVFDLGEGQIAVYDSTTGDLDRTLGGFTTGAIQGIEVSADGGRMIIKRVQDVAVWDSQTGQPQSEVAVEGYHWAASRDGRMAAVFDGFSSVMVWDLDRGDSILSVEEHEDTNWIQGVAFSPDETMLAVDMYEEGIVFYSLDSGEVVRSFPDMDMNQSGKFAVDETSFFAWSSRMLGVWDSDSGERRYQLARGRGNWEAFDIAPDQCCIAILIDDGLHQRIEVRDIESGEVLWDHIFEDTAQPVTQLVYSPDSSLLAVGRNHGFINILDARTGHPIVDYHHVGLSDIAFAPDGLWLASSSSDGTVILWDVPY